MKKLIIGLISIVGIFLSFQMQGQRLSIETMQTLYDTKTLNQADGFLKTINYTFVTTRDDKAEYMHNKLIGVHNFAYMVYITVDNSTYQISEVEIMSQDVSDFDYYKSQAEENGFELVISRPENKGISYHYIKKEGRQLVIIYKAKDVIEVSYSIVKQ